ncbi:MAG: exo-alpha-sialidase [Actinobacteria bacterium]|nr:exo-alpha-sialidase [Actinomycetota bacterium]
MTGHAIVLVGTTKGAFVLRPDASRTEVNIDGPHFAGDEVYSMALDTRAGRQRILAGRLSMHFGPGIAWSDDLGANWIDPPEGAIAFPPDTDAALQRVWQIEPAGDGEPDVIYAGVEPAALFRSTDAGESFDLVRGLWDHPHRPLWNPGGGGLCLHTIVRDHADPQTVWTAISSGGVYRTTDGGETWEARNRGIRTPFAPDPEPPEYGQCVHKMARHPGRPERLYLQHHWGTYRSDDRGDTWVSVGESMPADAPPVGSEPRPFGFPIVVHPHDPDTVYVIPLSSDMHRWTVDGRCRVFRSRDGGDTWEGLSDGLPQEHAYLTVLRDAFCADPLEPAGLWFGTRTGDVFASADEGDTWQSVARHLPPVVCVKAYAL